MIPNVDQIPDGWQLVRLDDIAEIVGGSTPSRAAKEYWDGSIPWVVPSEITELSGRYLSSTKESITDVGRKSTGLKILPSNSILLTSRATIGELAINTIPVTTNQGFQNVVVKNGTDLLWLYYLLNSMRHELRRRASGSTFLEISRDSVRSLPILLPTLEEQRAIAAMLDSVDYVIETGQEEVAQQRELRTALSEALLTGWVRAP
ncbi:MAG: restriction endonuclease subunit S [bacterium]|nr:restriction endonuclease subunit S [bacterium]